MTCLMGRSLSGALIKLHTSMLGTFFVYTLAQNMPIFKKKSSFRFLGKSFNFFILVKLILLPYLYPQLYNKILFYLRAAENPKQGQQELREMQFLFLCKYTKVQTKLPRIKFKPKTKNSFDDFGRLRLK